MKSIVAAAMLCLLLGRHGSAQNVITLNNGDHAAGQPRMVTITFQLAMPAAGTTSATDMTKTLAATSQSLYDVVNHECEVLTAALKGSCRLSRLMVGGNLNEPNANIANFANRPNAAPMVTANATAVFEIAAPAADVAAPAAASSKP